jgi:hypothetical protein
MATKKVIKKTAPKKAASLKKTVVKKTTVKPAPAPKVVTVPKPEVVDPNIYPIGKMKRPEEFTETVLNKLIQDIRILPEHLKKVAKKIKHKKQLQYSYRDGGMVNRTNHTPYSRQPHECFYSFQVGIN